MTRQKWCIVQHYFTRAAQAIRSIEDGTDYDGRNLQEELSEGEASENINYVFVQLVPEIRKESKAKARAMNFNKFEEEDLDSILQEIVASEFYKYNSPMYMTDGTIKCEVSTFISDMVPRAVRIYLCEKRNLPINAIRNLRLVEKAMYDLAIENDLSQDEVTVEMVKAKLADKSISLNMIATLMNQLKGNLSLNVMLEENDVRLSQIAVEDEVSVSEEVDPEVQAVLDNLFGKMSNTELCLLMKQCGILGETFLKMDDKDFVKTELFDKVFSLDDSIRSKKNPVKSAYNKNASREKKIVEFREFFKEAGLAMDGISGELLLKYCMERWNKITK